MKEVCRPVGMKAIELSKENGWQVKQISTKYRNPAHSPDTPHARMALAQFEQKPELMGFWERSTLGGQAGNRYYRRINIEASCLACHGQQKSTSRLGKFTSREKKSADSSSVDVRRRTLPQSDAVLLGSFLRDWAAFDGIRLIVQAGINTSIIWSMDWP